MESCYLEDHLAEREARGNGQQTLESEPGNFDNRMLGLNSQQTSQSGNGDRDRNGNVVINQNHYHVQQMNVINNNRKLNEPEDEDMMS